MGIKQASYFSPCKECGLHGHIVYADGAKSVEFGTVSKGLKVLNTLVLEGKNSKDRAPEVRRQIQASELESKNAETDEAMEALLKRKESFHELFAEVHREIHKGGALPKKKSGEKRILQ
jgi:hypothetical protein